MFFYNNFFKNPTISLHIIWAAFPLGDVEAAAKGFERRGYHLRSRVTHELFWTSVPGNDDFEESTRTYSWAVNVFNTVASTQFVKLSIAISRCLNPFFEVGMDGCLFLPVQTVLWRV
jgi:hypothetical protein